jgi:ribonucleotide reductase alpha subunit
LANLGTNKGMPVACSGQYIGDSVADFYGELLDTAVLTKNGFGTSGYLGDIRPRGSQITAGGTASGVLPVFQTYVDAMKRVTQGVAWAFGAMTVSRSRPDEAQGLSLATVSSPTACSGWPEPTQTWPPAR